MSSWITADLKLFVSGICRVPGFFCLSRLELGLVSLGPMPSAV
jgi:hypothetical protein